jgi:hypothetical protein
MVSTDNPWDDEFDPNDDPMYGYDEYGNEPNEIEIDPQYGQFNSLPNYRPL